MVMQAKYMPSSSTFSDVTNRHDREHRPPQCVVPQELSKRSAMRNIPTKL